MSKIKIRIKSLDEYLRADDKKENIPDYTLKDLMGTMLVGYKGSNKLILKKLPVRTEIYDGETLIGSIDERNNVYWDDKIYNAFKTKRKIPQFKAIYDNASESQFDVQVEELSQEEKDKISASQRGVTAEKVRQAFVDKFGDRVVQLQGGVEIDKDLFLETIKATFGTAFNKFGAILAKWSLDETISDRRLEEKQRFITALSFLVSAHEDEYDENFNGLKPQDIIRKFADDIQDQSSKDKNAVNEMEETKSDYTVVQITSEQQAQSYFKYVGIDGTDRQSQWCITRSSWNSYVGNADEGKAELFYFLLKDGYDKYKRAPDTNEFTPLDEYGLSMIAVSIKDDGTLKTATCRWNHANGGNDSMFTVTDLSELLGRSFYKACPPLTDPEEKMKMISKLIFKLEIVDNKILGVYNGKIYLLEDKKLVKDAYGYPYSAIKILKVMNKGKQLAWLLQTGETEYMSLDLDLNIIIKPDTMDVRTAKERVYKITNQGGSHE